MFSNNVKHFDILFKTITSDNYYAFYYLLKNYETFVLEAVDSTGQTALLAAVANARLRMIESLIKAGASDNVKTPDGSGTLMHWAAKHGNEDIMQWLRDEHGFDASQKDTWGFDANQYLAAYKSVHEE
jgi:ankyrin repeat protein